MNRAERVLALLTARYPGWVPAIELEAPGGRQAWRTAVSEARTLAKRDGGDIENRTRREWIPGQGWEAWILSEYRLKRADEYQPTVSPQGHDINSAAPGRVF